MKRILVVDDTKNIRMLLSKCLELEGYEVDTAADGLKAVEMLKNNKYNLMFLDIKLPEISGTEVLKKIRILGINTPVIIITAYATVKNAVECTKMGAVAYLQKPFTGEKVISVLNESGIFEIQENNEQPDKILSDAKALIDNMNYNEALELLKANSTKELENPEMYLLLSIAYEGIREHRLAEKFYNTYKLFKK